MNHRSRLVPAALLSLGVLASTPFALADSLQVSSQSGSTSTFDLLLSGPASFNSGATITLTGLSNVSNVNYVGYTSYFGTLSNTGSSITLTINNNYTYDGSSGPIDVQLFTASTSGPVPVPGNASYNLQEANGNVRGTVTAPTPEPASLLLLGTGGLATIGLARRRLFGRL